MATKSLRPISPEWQPRFWRRVDICGEDECWIWLGGKTDQFYGYCHPYGAKHRWVLAHRVSYFLSTGRDPGNDKVRHTCDNTLCVNPKHLLAGTQGQNMADMRERGRDYKFPVIYGENSPDAKLTDAEVAEIRRLAGTTIRRPEGYGRQFIPGYWSHKRLAAKFGVGASQIGRILRGESR